MQWIKLHYWNKRGLNFECHGCGRCCTGKPGYVFILDDEIEKISGYLKITKEGFGKKYCRDVHGILSLIEYVNGDCIFWSKEKGCSIYPVRPVQCVTYPFWYKNVKTKRSWKQAGIDCPGVGSGKNFSWSDIEKMVNINS